MIMYGLAEIWKQMYYNIRSFVIEHVLANIIKVAVIVLL